MISDERLEEVINGDILFIDEQREMAKELHAYRKAFSEPAVWRNNDGPFGRVATCSHKVGELWVSEGFDVIPLYRKPIIPE